MSVVKILLWKISDIDKHIELCALLWKYCHRFFTILFFCKHIGYFKCKFELIYSLLHFYLDWQIISNIKLPRFLTLLVILVSIFRKLRHKWPSRPLQMKIFIFLEKNFLLKPSAGSNYYLIFNFINYKKRQVV